jgi:omega-6 fatty acid desaturase (delta-12 desaturase)
LQALNYSLQRAHDENEIFHDAPTIGFLDGIKATRLKLYDPERSRLVTWRQGNARRKAKPKRRPEALPAS